MMEIYKEVFNMSMKYSTPYVGRGKDVGKVNLPVHCIYTSFP